MMEEKLKIAKDDEIVELRGFLYPVEAGHWILSPEPNLKSCCVGARELSKHQVHLYGDFPLELLNRAVSVQGKIKILNVNYYEMHSPKVVKESELNLSLILAAGFILGLVYYLWRNCFRKKRDLR